LEKSPARMTEEAVGPKIDLAAPQSELQSELKFEINTIDRHST